MMDLGSPKTLNSQFLNYLIIRSVYGLQFIYGTGDPAQFGP